MTSIKRTDREGQRVLASYVDSAVHRAFNILAAKESTTSVALMHEAIGLVLARHGEPLPQPVIDHLKQNNRPLPFDILNLNTPNNG